VSGHRFGRRRQDLTPELPLIAKFKADEATQGVAADRTHFYAIANATIGKYERNTGRKVASFRSTPRFRLFIWTAAR
jgi:hypothetical protein